MFPSVKLRTTVIPVARGVAVLAVVTLAATELHLNTAAAGFLYLVAIVLNCLDAGFLAAAIVSIVAVGCLDWFFVDPRYTWTVSDPVDAVALFCFLMTSMTVTRLSITARVQAKAARREHHNLTGLYQVSQRLLALEPLDGEQAKMPELFRRVFGLEAASLFDANTAELHTAGTEVPALGDRTRDAYIMARDADEPAHRQAFRCLRVSGKVVGAIGLQGPEGVHELASPLAALTAAALERARAANRASLAAAEAKAEALRAAILDALAHEFKTPLATILTAAGGLREAGPLGQAQAELAGLVETEAERLSHLSSQLLWMAKLDSEEVKPRLEPADLVATVAEIIERYTRHWPERRFVFEKQGRANEILADHGLLQIALSQLLDNACRYSPSDSPVKVTLAFEGSLASVVVWNAGASIPPAEGARIFDRFYRGTDAQRTTSGSGVGLYVARKITVAHGGALDLDYQQAAEGGVAFRLELPALVERI